MRIDSTELIHGIPLLKIRDFMREASQPNAIVHDDWVEHYFKLDSHQAISLRKELVSRGWLISAYSVDSNRWRTTLKGHQFAHARAGKPFHREVADKHLSALLERVCEMDAIDDLLQQATSVVVFGSYLAEAPVLGDVDVVVDLKTKPQFGCTPQQEIQSALRLLSQTKVTRAERSWLFDLGDLGAWMCARGRALAYLRARSTVLSLRLLSEENMWALVPHRVLYGDAALVQQRQRDTIARIQKGVADETFMSDPQLPELLTSPYVQNIMASWAK